MDREKTHVKRENYITIQGWMITDLELKGNDLLIYAIIYGFSQTDSQWFTGSRQYLADWTNSTKQGVQKCLNSLVSSGLLNKREWYENNVKFCEYQTTDFTGQQSLPVNKVYHPNQQSLPPQSTKFTGGSQQSLPPQSTKFTVGSQQSLPNIIDNNTIDNTEENNRDITRRKTNSTQKKNTTKNSPPVYYPDELLNQTFLDYIAMRKTMKKPMTDRAIQLAMNRLKELATPERSFRMDNDLAIKILEQSIMSCWQGLFPLKEEYSTKQNKRNDFDEWRELYEQAGNN